MSDLIQTTMVHKRAVEKLFCACLFIQAPETVIHDCGWLRPEQFHDEHYRQFWQLVIDGKQPTEAAITAEVYSELIDAQSQIISSMEYTSYANQIAEDDRYMNYAIKLPNLARAVMDRDNVLLTKTMAELNERTTGHNTALNAAEIGLEFYDSIWNGKIDTIYTGISDFDMRTGGLERGTMTLVAARPGMGKSAILANIAEHNARNGRKVLVISLEMSRRQLWARICCGYAGLTWQKVRKGELNPLEMQRLEKENVRLIDALDNKLIVDDNSRQTMDDVWKMTAQTKADIVIIDHLSLLSDKGESEIKRLGAISWAGKQIAKEFNCCVMFAQQLNRGVEHRGDNKRPMLSDLRDSGELEQNADQVVFLYREDYYNGNALTISPTELLIAKYRDGQVGGVKVMFNQPQQRFYCVEAK